MWLLTSLLGSICVAGLPFAAGSLLGKSGAIAVLGIPLTTCQPKCGTAGWAAASTAGSCDLDSIADIFFLATACWGGLAARLL
jgi:hypothetical protein